jgi:hypothetical protein
MRNIENRIGRLERALGDKPSPVQFIVVPREVPYEQWDSYINERADGRPMLVFPEGIPLEEAMKQVGVVEIEGE